MRAIVTGSTGLIGAALVAALRGDGHGVTRLVRRPPRAADEARWDPGGGVFDPAPLEGHDAAVHLAGESIAQRWTPRVRARIRDSRVVGTRVLSEALAGLERPPRVLVSASGIGYYGDRGDEVLTESSAPGDSYLSRVASEWEAATATAEERGIRAVHLRNALALSPRGGVLGRLLPIFRLGLGGPIGDGRAWWSWIALPDLVAVARRAIDDEALAGPVIAAAPEPVTNGEFTRVLARVLGRPAFLRVPPAALRLAYGEMADEALLASARAVPRRLEQAGFRHRFPRLEEALRHLLDRRGS